MDGQPEEQTKTSIHDQVERAVKTLPLALAALYVVGFLIVAFHLAGYGAFSLDLIKVQYLAAGFWFACILLFFFGLTASVRILVSELIFHMASGVRWRSKKATALAGAAVADSFFAVVLVFCSYLFRGPNQPLTETIYSIRYLLAGLIVFDTSLRTWLYMRERANDSAIHQINKRHSWRTVTVISNFMAKGLHTEVDYVLLHDGHKFYAACDTTTLDKLDPTATCAFRVLRSYECVQPADKKPNKALSDLRCKDDESHPVYLYVSKKE